MVTLDPQLVQILALRPGVTAISRLTQPENRRADRIRSAREYDVFAGGDRMIGSTHGRTTERSRFDYVLSGRDVQSSA